MSDEIARVHLNLFSIFIGSICTTPSDDQSSISEIYRTVADQISSEVSDEEVAKLINEHDINKDAGPVEPSPRFYKLTAATIAPNHLHGFSDPP